MFNKLNPREKNLVVLLLIVIVGFGFFKYLLQPELTKRTELVEAYAAQEEKLAKTKIVADSYAKVAQEEKRVEKSLAEVKERFSTKSTDGSTEVKFGYDANNNRVNILLFQPAHITILEDYIELPIRMEIIGEYLAITDFLTTIEGFYNVTEITDLAISNEKPDELSPNPALKAAFTFKIYTTNPPEELSTYASLNQWTVGRINSFGAGVRAIANWDSNVGDAGNGNNWGNGANPGMGGISNGPDSQGGSNITGSGDSGEGDYIETEIGILK